MHLVALLCLTLMTGNEVCIAAFVEPVLRSLLTGSQITAAPRIAALLGRVMPFWYAGSLIFTISDVVLQHGKTGRLPIGATTSVVVQGMVLLLTITMLVPLNNKLARMTEAYEGWLADAQRWDLLHRVRVGLLLAACIALAWTSRA